MKHYVPLLLTWLFCFCRSLPPTAPCSGMERVGMRCETHYYDDVGHTFFNREPHRMLTLIEADKFLASLGWLQGPPTGNSTK